MRLFRYVELKLYLEKRESVETKDLRFLLLVILIRSTDAAYMMIIIRKLLSLLH